MPAATYALSIHAAYGCRDRGACCTAGWPIPIEADRLAAAERATAAGRLIPSRPVRVVFPRKRAAPASSPALVATVDGACVFYHGHGAGRCEIHRALGHTALPLACRQFPRVSIRDPRGTAITLSHYCPTAAEMIAAPAALNVVQNAPAFPPDGGYVGLDATEAIPPLLRPDMAMDWESWWMCERLAVDTFARSVSAAEALARLRTAVEVARTWRPAEGPLAERVKSAFRSTMTVAPCQAIPDATLIDDVRASIDADLRPPLPASAPDAAADVAHRHFLAAHAFANWTAYLGLGLRSWLRSVEAADALVRAGLSISAVDLWLRHLADPQALAKRLSPAEAE